jgi:hypothetical protein
MIVAGQAAKNAVIARTFQRFGYGSHIVFVFDYVGDPNDTRNRSGERPLSCDDAEPSFRGV